MNIAFIFAYRNTDIWSTPLSIVNEFKERGWTTDIYSLFDENDNYTEINVKRLIFERPQKHYDIIMFMDWGRFDSTWLDKKHLPNSYWVMESGDDPQNFTRNMPKAHKFHLILTPDYQSYLQYQNRNHDVLWWNHFADTTIHHMYDTDNFFPPVRSTRGPGGSQLMDYLSQVMPEKFINRNGLYGEEYGEFLGGGLIVFQQSRWKEITRRIFEGMATGNLVITDRLPQYTHINDLFVENQDIVYYDDPAEAISKINYYLWNIDERSRISFNGWNIVKSNHTQVQRVDSIIKKFNSWNN